MKGDLTGLRQLIAKFVVIEMPTDKQMNQDEVHAWLRSKKLASTVVSPLTGKGYGLGPEGLMALADFAAAFRKSVDRYLRGTDLRTFEQAIATCINKRFVGTPGKMVNASDFADFAADVEAWFAEQSVGRTHVVPCSILPERASRFAIGPISFIHIDEFLESAEAFHRLAYEQLIEMTRQRGGFWLAKVPIDGCEEKRSTELADLAVDIALVGVQLVIPLDYSRHVARVTARTIPPWRGNVAISTKGQIHSGVEVLMPGHGFSGPAFDLFLAKKQDLIASVGRRVQAYLSAGKLPKLERGWCDAAYWFREGLAEPLDTIATAKHETAIEVLMRAENSSGSSTRMRKAIKAFFGKERGETLSPTSSVTVDALIKSLVGARSQILHGTLSTLKDEARVNRQDATKLAGEVIYAAALKLDTYSALPTATDDVDKFLEWIDSTRASSP